MGNKSSEIIYERSTITIENIEIPYEHIKKQIRTYHPELKSESITIRVDPTNKFICTDHKWRESPYPSNTKFYAYKQVANSVFNDKENSLLVSRSMFKMLNPVGKILGTGFKISTHFCVFPKIFLPNRNLIKDFSLEFFDDSVCRFKENGFLIEISDQNGRFELYLAEIDAKEKGIVKNFVASEFQTTGKITYFDKKTKMLEAVDFSETNVFINSSFNLNLPHAIKNMPGAVLTNGAGHIIGITIRHHCIAYKKVLNDVSNILEDQYLLESICRDEETKEIDGMKVLDLKKKILGIIGIRIKLSNSLINYQDIAIPRIPELEIKRFILSDRLQAV